MRPDRATPIPLDPEQEFRQRVLGAYDELPPQQKLVADYLLEHVRELSFFSVPELAVKSSASEATIVRFAQRIGYEGWSGLKAAFAEGLREKIVPGLPPAAEALARTPEKDALTAVASLEIQNIQRSLELCDRRALREVADALYEARHVYTFGLGISSHLAQLCAYSLVQIGIAASAIAPTFSSPREPLTTARREDLVVLFSFPPYSGPTVRLAQDAKKRNIPSIAITDQETSPVARAAWRRLVVRSDNMMFTNAFAAVSVLMNGLVTEAAVRHKDQAAKAGTRITEILAEEADLVR